MVTPDFEDWLERQDIPVEDTTELDKYLTYLEDQLGIHGKSLEVGAKIYDERYEIMETLGIRAVERHYTVQGEPFVETRYGISEMPGLWGRYRATEIAAERAQAAGRYDAATTMRARIEDMDKQPERRKIKWREPTP